MDETQINCKPLILIVDDIDRNVLLLKDYCVALGYCYETASNANEAFDKMKMNKPDLVLLDIFMPGVSGDSFLEKLKKDDGYKDIPVIMISGVDELELVIKCIELGAADYLLKPVNMDLLKARLTACLREKELHDNEIRLYAELKESYDKLKKTEYMRDVLSHMIVHDLKNPLTSIKGNAELLQMTLSGKAQELSLKSILSGVKQLQTLISQILDVSKMESGEMALHPENFDLAELLKNIHEDYCNLFESRKVALKFDANSESVNVNGDKVMLERVVQNLLINALKYSRPGMDAFICIAEDKETKEVVISVKDQGVGVPKDKQNCIFDKFYQIQEDNKNSRNRYGVGLGLYFCKTAVDKHGGRIWIESEGQNKGSAFSFSLPIIQE